MEAPVTITIGPLSVAVDHRAGTQHPVALSHTGGTVRLTQGQAATLSNLLSLFSMRWVMETVRYPAGTMPPRLAQEFGLPMHGGDLSNDNSNADPGDEHHAALNAVAAATPPSADGYRVEAIESEWLGDCAAIAERHAGHQARTNGGW